MLLNHIKQTSFFHVGCLCLQLSILSIYSEYAFLLLSYKSKNKQLNFKNIVFEIEVKACQIYYYSNIIMSRRYIKYKTINLVYRNNFSCNNKQIYDENYTFIMYFNIRA